MLFLNLALLFFPFIILFFFNDAKKGFLYSVVFFFSFHLISAFVYQYFGAFDYGNLVLASIGGIISIALPVSILKKRPRMISVRPLFLIVFLCIGLQLWGVHYNYTGPVQTLNGTLYAVSDSYSYPLFSDEWVAASLSRHVIDTGRLPFTNPFMPGSFFENLLFPFHTFISQIFLLLQLDPVADFATIPIFLGVLTCLVSYVFLRSCDVSSAVSLLSVACIPLITQSGSLPGIWFALPYSVGFLFLLIHIIGLSNRDMSLAISGALISFIFYPPIIVFLAPSIVYYAVKHRKYSLIFIFAPSLLLFFVPDIPSKIIRDNLDGGILQFPIGLIVPVLLIPFMLVGLSVLYKKKIYEVLIPTLVGLAYWSFYSFFPGVLIIEYPRVVSITAVFLVLTAGIGLNLFDRYISKAATLSALLVALLFITAAYPNKEKWLSLVLVPSPHHQTNFIPASAPVSRYLSKEDLDLFSSFSEKVFVAPPWKGLVLGSATDNFPLETKASTITTMILSYDSFMGASCEEKDLYVKTHDIAYVYSSRIECPKMNPVGRSSEGLTLYRIEDSD